MNVFFIKKKYDNWDHWYVEYCKKAAFATSVYIRATCCNAEPKNKDKPINRTRIESFFYLFNN